MGQGKKIFLMGNIVFILLILFTLSRLRSGIMRLINDRFVNREITVLNLTTDEKVADFEEFYNNMIESVPLLKDQKALYNIDFKNRKEYYLDLIKNTQNDFEFFCMMSAIQQDIPSMHTDICTPVYSHISNLGCYNDKQTFVKRNIKPLTEYWYECIGKACKQFVAVQRMNFKYINGQYLFDPMNSYEKYQELQGFELAAINDQLMKDYVVSNLSYNNIRYDYKRNISYRRYFTLNDSVGEKVKVTLINSETGKTVNKELYFDIKIEVVDSLSYLYEEKIPSIDNSNHEDRIYSYFDYKNDIGYVRIKDFMNSEGKVLMETLESMKEFDSIIIDLRGNYGGFVRYAQRYLYSPIYSDDVTITYNWFVPDSDSNKAINNTIPSRFFFHKQKNENGFNYTRKHTYRGGAHQAKQSIYYLVNSYTGSVADGYIALVKKNKLGTIIGTNTRGEGVSDSFICNALKNSGLVYIYFPSLSYNQDGTNNSLYGTSPDVYIEQTKESFYQERNLKEKQIDINSYTEKIKYDNILIKTIEMIEESHN